jgi:archaellum component FlaF (FlaF/FlaG flagellin family)
MGAETSVVVALFFLGFLVISAFTYSWVDSYQNLVNNAQQIQDTMKNAKMQTDIAITNSSITNFSYSSYLNITYLNITLQNTDKTTLNASRVEIFIDGVFCPDFTLSPPINTLVPEKTTTIKLYAKGSQDANITIDNPGTYTKSSSGGPGPAPNITNFAVGSGTYRLLIVGVNYYNNPGTTNVKYNGVNLTLAMRANKTVYYAELWYMINPPSGSYTINQTQTTTGGTQVVMGAWSYTGVDQVTGIGNITNATGSSLNTSVNITTTLANSVLVDVDTDTAPGSPAHIIHGAGQTQRYENDTLNNIDAGGEEMNTTTIQTYNMNWTLPGSAAWVDIAAEILPHTTLTCTTLKHGSRIKIVTENGISAYAIVP